MKKNILIICLSILLGASGFAKAENVTKEEFGNLVKNYLLENPQVIIDAVAQMQKQEMSREMSVAKEAIKENYKAIYENKAHGSIGSDNANVKIVEFFDYNCSACKYMFKPLDELRKAGLEDLKIIFIEHPIFGEQSNAIARIALVVNQLMPAKYYEFHSKMMQHKGKIDAKTAYGYAEKVGLKRNVIEKELEKDKYSVMLNENAKLGEDLKLRGTPFLIIGDEPVPSALDAEGLKQFISKAKQK